MRKIHFLSIIFILFLSSTVLFAQAQVESGSFSVNPNTPNYTLDKNTGDRSVTIDVTFDKPFDVKPQIVLSVTSVDADTKSNVRYSVEPGSISRDGFTITVRTWSETKIFAVSGYWLAHADKK